jgi:hypothetical protein
MEGAAAAASSFRAAVYAGPGGGGATAASAPAHTRPAMPPLDVFTSSRLARAEQQVRSPGAVDSHAHEDRHRRYRGDSVSDPAPAEPLEVTPELVRSVEERVARLRAQVRWGGGGGRVGPVSGGLSPRPWERAALGTIV